MKKNDLYQDRQVRGQNCHPEQKIVFTELAKKKYEDLTGTQKTFINNLLNEIELSKKNIAQEISNKELAMQVKYRNCRNQIMIIDIEYPSRQNDPNYIKAKQRMLDWNN